MSQRTFDERRLCHARRFLGKQQPQNVLKRYEQRLRTGQVDELQKNAFHAAAWVSELPAGQMSLQYDGLSAMCLLHQYLRSLKEIKPL